jgi:hypothetical protein
MYASLRHYKMGAGSIDSLMQRVDEEFVPTLAQEPGFVFYFGLDTGNHTVQTISTFQDKNTAFRSNELSAKYVNENLGEYQLTRTDVVAGEILVSRLAPGLLEDMKGWRTERARRRGW